MTHIAACLDAVAKQLTPEMQVMIVDNASIDGTVPWIAEHYPQFHLLRNTRNWHYCRSHNQALRLTSSEFVLVLNPDVILGDNWIQRGLEFLKHDATASSFGGKTLRFSYTIDDMKDVVPSDIIDSCGLLVRRNRHTTDRGSGETDHGQYDTAGKVFGFSGACVMYRRSALESVTYLDEVFDNDIFAYKDDLDLSWRLQRMGWNAWYDPRAVARHYRGIKGVSATSDRLIAKNHRSRTRLNSYYSYRNHYLVLMKNERWSTLWRDMLWMKVYEVKKFVFLTFTRQPSINAILDAIRLWPKMRRKAKVINHQAKRSALEVRRWFIGEQS